MKLSQCPPLFRMLDPARIGRFGRTVLGVTENDDVETYHLLCLGLANWLETFNVCNEAQAMIFFQEFGETLKWYADEADRVFKDLEAEPVDLPLLVMVNDFRYFQTHNYQGFFDIQQAVRLEELPRPTVTYVSADCLAMLARLQEGIDQLKEHGMLEG